MKYYLAPMEGITGYVFRNVYHHCFPAMDKYFTPFLSPNSDGKLSPRELQDVDPKHNEGMKVVPQILTNCAEDFIRTAATLKDMGYDEVNLNLGCPSGTVVSKGKGSGFLAFPEKLNQCLDEIFSRLDMKISVKTRTGKVHQEEFFKLLEIYNKYKMEELIIHPRVQKDGYKHTPSLLSFSHAYQESANPLCYNGDVFRAEDEHRISEMFPGLPAMMLGRGIAANPGLLLEIKQDGSDSRAAKERLKEFHDCLYEAYCRVYLKSSGPRVVLFKMKELWCYLALSWDSKSREEDEGKSEEGEAIACDMGNMLKNNQNKALKKLKKAQNLREYEAAAALMFNLSREAPASKP